jgi:hypothetical protein
MGGAGKIPDKRKYKYRLETSLDGEYYDVLYDTCDEGYNGWQQFLIESGIAMRFIRIYGRYNSANNKFHIVELEAYQELPPPSLDARIILEKKLTNQKIEDEPSANKNSDIDELSFKENNANKNIEIQTKEPIIKGGPLSKVNDIVKSIQKAQEHIDSAKLEMLCQDLLNVTGDLEILEKNIESVRRQIIDPVTKELKKSSKWAMISILLAFISILSTLPWSKILIECNSIFDAISQFLKI